MKVLGQFNGDIDVSDLPTGLYVLRVQNKYYNLTERFIVK